MNTYVCYYKSKKTIVNAQTSYRAQLLAANEFKVPPGKEYKVDVFLAQKDSDPVTTVITS